MPASAELVGDPDDCTARCVITDDRRRAPRPEGRLLPGRLHVGRRSRLLARVRRRRRRADAGETCDIAHPAGRRPAPARPPATTRSRAPTTAWSAPGTCAARCVLMPDHRRCVPGDGCCPPGGDDFMLDPDCAPVVRQRRRREAGRELRLRRRRGLPEGRRRCPSNDACTRYAVTGRPDACSAACVATPITACVDGDGCCPPGCTARRRHGLPRRSAATASSSTGESCDRAITAGPAGRLPAHLRRRRRLHARPGVRARSKGCSRDLQPPAASPAASPATAAARTAAPADDRQRLRPDLRRRARSARARPAIRPAPARPPARTTATRARASS